jgi:hypothetical protein
MRLKDLGYLYSGLTGKSGEDFNAEIKALDAQLQEVKL